MDASKIDLNTTPAAPPPPGVTPNLVNPRTMWPTLLPTIIISLTATVIAVSIRLFTKLHLLRKLAYEDYVLILAQASLIVWCVLLVVQPTHGADIWNTSLAQYSEFAYWSNLIIVLYVPGVLLAKWAILLQLQRVFCVQTRDSTWWTVRALIWISSIFYVTVGLFDVFQCVPREKIWNPMVPGHCFNIQGILIGTSVFNFVMNCSILMLPLVVLQGVQMQKRKKVVVSLVFCVTGLAAVSSIMRTIYSVLFLKTQNPTRDIFPVAYWAIAEIACIILATTFPTMPRFIEYVRAGFDPRATPYGAASSPAASRRKTIEPVSASQRGGRKSWYQLTALGDEDPEKQRPVGSQADIMENRDVQDGRSEGDSTAPPSRGERGDMGGIMKTIEVEVTTAV